MKNLIEKYLPESGYKRILVIFAYCIILISAYLFFSKWLMLCITPFILGWLVALMIQKPINTLYEKKKIPKKITGAFYIVLITALPVSVGFLLVSKIIAEGYKLYGFIGKNLPAITSKIEEISDSFFNALNTIPLLSGGGERLSEELNDHFSDLLITGFGEIISSIPSFATTLADLLPKVFIFVLIFCISAYCLSIDFSKVNSMVLGVFSPEASSFLRRYKCEFFSVSKKYFRAYSLIFIISLTELFLGLTVLRIPHAFSLSLIISFVDILPILGCGTVLVPWCIIEYFLGNFSLGTGILVLYIVITVIRQFIEPKIVGDFIGLHPLAALMCIFIGLNLFGFIGLFLLPICVISFINVLKRENHT